MEEHELAEWIKWNLTLEVERWTNGNGDEIGEITLKLSGVTFDSSTFTIN